jgi:hypothetical protein
VDEKLPAVIFDQRVRERYGFMSIDKRNYGSWETIKYALRLLGGGRKDCAPSG